MFGLLQADTIFNVYRFSCQASYIAAGIWWPQLQSVLVHSHSLQSTVYLSCLYVKFFKSFLFTFKVTKRRSRMSTKITAASLRYYRTGVIFSQSHARPKLRLKSTHSKEQI